jgi:hypothetical protein
MNNDNIFWFNNNFTTLFTNYNIIPYSNLSLDAKLNIMTRLILITSILAFLITQNSKVFIYAFLLVFSIIFLYFFEKNKKENFITVSTSSSSKKNKNTVPLKTILKEDFYQNNKSNPFGNVLINEISDTPLRESAPPSFNLEVEKQNTEHVKDAIQSLNPDIQDTNKQLFGDLYQQFENEQANRVFFSNPNTKVCNDQGAFGQFLYSDMISAKEGNVWALEKDNIRYTLY